MTRGYSKSFMPLNAVKEKEFLSRSMGCKGVGFSYVRRAGSVLRRRTLSEFYMIGVN